MRFHKHIALLLAFYHFGIGAGFAINLHFCKGELESVSTILTEVFCEKETVVAKCCSKKSITVDDSCCDHSIIDLTEVDDETTLNSDPFLFEFLTIIPDDRNKLFKKAIFKNKPQALPYFTFLSNAPPLYQLYCTYIYYA